MHKVSPNDTLDRISLMYNKPKDIIRRANDFTGDEIYYFKELTIPDSGNFYNSLIIIDGPVLASSISTYSEEQRRKE